MTYTVSGGMLNPTHSPLPPQYAFHINAVKEPYWAFSALEVY